MSIEHGVHSADRWQLYIGVKPSQLLADLRCAPARAFLLQLHDELLHLEWKLVGLAVGSATPIGESFQPAALVAIKDLVAGLAGDIELAAQHRHLLPIE